MNMDFSEFRTGINIYHLRICLLFRVGLGVNLLWLAGNCVCYLLNIANKQKTIYIKHLYSVKKKMRMREKMWLMESICLCMFYKIYLRMLNYLGCRGLFLPVVCLVYKSWKCTAILSYNTWKSFWPLTCFVIKASTINIGWWGIMVLNKRSYVHQ